MSYARTSEDDSDVYVIGTSTALECIANVSLEARSPVHALFEADDWVPEKGKMVRLNTKHLAPETFSTTSRQAMLNHLAEHQQAGHMVPERALDALCHEIATEGDAYPTPRPTLYATRCGQGTRCVCDEDCRVEAK